MAGMIRCRCSSGSKQQWVRYEELVAAGGCRMSDFVTELGRPFLAHRLKRAAELLVAGSGKWLPETGVTAPPRSMSALLLLRREGPLSVTDIAERLRFTHPLIIALLAQLESRGFTTVARDPNDARRRMITLTPEGERETDRVDAAAEVIGRAYQALFDEIGLDLLDAVSRLESACAAQPFSERLRAAADSKGSRKAASARHRSEATASSPDAASARRKG